MLQLGRLGVETRGQTFKTPAGRLKDGHSILRKGSCKVCRQRAAAHCKEIPEICMVAPQIVPLASATDSALTPKAVTAPTEALAKQASFRQKLLETSPASPPILVFSGCEHHGFLFPHLLRQPRTHSHRRHVLRRDRDAPGPRAPGAAAPEAERSTARRPPPWPRARSTHRRPRAASGC